MTKIPEYLQVGDRFDMTVEELLRIVEQLYTDIAIQLNKKVDLVQRTTDGLVSDVFLDQGTVNINLNTNKVEMLTNHTSPTNVIWTQISP